MSQRKSSGNQIPCSKCGENLPINGDFVSCYGSGGCYLHYKCSLSKSTYNAMSKQKKEAWRCFDCRKSDDQENEENNEEEVAKLSQKKKSFTMDDLGKELREISRKVGAIDNLKNIVDEVKRSVEFMNEKYEEFVKKIVEQEETIKLLKKNIEVLTKKEVEKDKTIEELQERIQEMEQYSRNKNIEISNVPELKDETELDLIRIVEKIAEKGNIPFQKEEIDVLHRLPTKKMTRAKNIVVQFKTRTARNLFLSKKKHGVTAEDLMDQGRGPNSTPTPIYINEHLTSQMKNLLWLTKQAAREKEYKMVWTREGKIFVKKDIGARETIRIRRKEDLNKI